MRMCDVDAPEHQFHNSHICEFTWGSGVDGAPVPWCTVLL